MTGTVLLTGGTGKTSTRIATKLQSRNISVLLASRGKTQSSGPITGFKTVKFDWFDESTYINPFNEDKNIDTIYIIVPSAAVESTPLVTKFIDLARQKGVNRFLLMSGGGLEKGAELAQGQVHAYLDTIGVDYAVLRPSWFFENFFREASSIKAKNELITATEKGKTGFISEDDIADVAVDLLTSSKLGGVEPNIFGPELLSHDDIAERFSQVLGRKITHRSVSVEERTAEYVKQGVPEQLAGVLATAEAERIASGGDEKLYNGPGAVKGKVRFVEFVKANKGVW